LFFLLWQRSLTGQDHSPQNPLHPDLRSFFHSPIKAKTTFFLRPADPLLCFSPDILPLTAFSQEAIFLQTVYAPASLRSLLSNFSFSDRGHNRVFRLRLCRASNLALLLLLTSFPLLPSRFFLEP